jgi:hypothetical protein
VSRTFFHKVRDTNLELNAQKHRQEGETMREKFQHVWKIVWGAGWIIILVSFTHLASAHEIYLKNGEIIKTPSVWEEDGKIMYKVDEGTVGISKNLVREIIYEPSPQLSAPADDIDRGLVAHYPFDGNAHDVIHPQNNGIVHGAQLAADRFRHLNRAYHFNGKNDYIQMDRHVLPDPPFSISFWFNVYTIRSDGQYLLSNGGQAGAPQGFYCRLLGEDEVYHSQIWPKSGIQCGISNAEDKFFAFVTHESLSAEEWHHVVFVWDGIPDVTHLFLYIDGNLVSVWTTTRIREDYNSPNNLRIGAPNDAVLANIFHGIIDDIRIYDRVLSAKEIQQLNQDTYK